MNAKKPNQEFLSRVFAPIVTSMVEGMLAMRFGNSTITETETKLIASAIPNGDVETWHGVPAGSIADELLNSTYDKLAKEVSMTGNPAVIQTLMFAASAEARLNMQYRLDERWLKFAGVKKTAAKLKDFGDDAHCYMKQVTNRLLFHRRQAYLCAGRLRDAAHAHRNAPERPCARDGNRNAL